MFLNQNILCFLGSIGFRDEGKRLTTVYVVNPKGPMFLGV